MDQIRIIFFDIDGTLVDPQTGRISEKTKYTLTRLKENGFLLCISSGRSPAALPPFSCIRFDAYCTFNGSLCYSGDQVIRSNPLSARDVARVLENAAGLGRPVSVATRHRLAANGFDKDLADYYGLAKQPLTVAEDFSEACREEIYQIMLGCRPCDHEAILKGTRGVKIAVSWDRAVDVIPASSGKGAAISAILAYFSVDASQALAFGDGLNDVDMLMAVGTGVAMGNASPQLKAVADEVCLPVSEEGIYHYCVSHGLI